MQVNIRLMLAAASVLAGTAGALMLAKATSRPAPPPIVHKLPPIPAAEVSRIVAIEVAERPVLPAPPVAATEPPPPAAKIAPIKKAKRKAKRVRQAKLQPGQFTLPSMR